MSRSINKHGCPCGGNDHTTAHHVRRARERAAIRKIINSHEEDWDEVIFPFTLDECQDLWAAPRDGQSTLLSLQQLRKELNDDISKILNDVHWFGRSDQELYLEHLFNLKNGKSINYKFLTHYFSWLGDRRINAYLKSQEDPFEALCTIPGKYTESFLRSRYRKMMSK